MVTYVSLSILLNTAGELIACCDEFLKIFNEAYFSLLLNFIGRFITFFSLFISSKGERIKNYLSPKLTSSPADIISSFE